MSPPRRIAGNIALDFANTVSWRGTGRETDHLATYGDLSVWAFYAGLIGPDTVDLTMEQQTFLLARAHVLREAVGAIGSAFAHGSEPPGSATGPLREVLANTLSRAALAGMPLRPLFAPPDRIAGAVAWSALDLFGGPESGRIKQCPFHDCRWLFVDRTKNGSRRWCEMTTCGNRAKKLAMKDAAIVVSP